MSGEEEEREGIKKFLEGLKQKAGTGYDKVTGAEFRKQFEEFTAAVTTVVLGIHSDQRELRERLIRVESARSEKTARNKASMMVISALIISILGFVLSVIAIIRTLR